jgi:porphobilinogen synthase
MGMGRGGNDERAAESEVIMWTFRNTQLVNALAEAGTALAPADLVMVLLVRDQPGAGGALATLDARQLRRRVPVLAGLGIRAVKVFAGASRRDRSGAAGKASGSLMARAIGEIKAADPGMTVITETCLCSYTETGECHLAGRQGKPDVQGTLGALAEQAVAQAAAGADIVGPAAMLPGSVRAVRRALDESRHSGAGIMPHLIFDSRLYDGYRKVMGAVPASGDARPFQARPGQPHGAVDAGLRFVAEGAGMLLLEPAVFCADILVALRAACGVPLAPFSVSGEYARFAPADGRDWRLMTELCLMLKRSGASQIITYAAADLAAALS